MAKMKPTGLKPGYLRQLVDVLSADPPGRDLANTEAQRR
jgi:hypothetical protein